uniref:Uncharacterized protein n=1 Tax=Octopus bimaculoides TaxID=37653 RepID=A0A0L8G6L7_OCTBM
MTFLAAYFGFDFQLKLWFLFSENDNILLTCFKVGESREKTELIDPFAILGVIESMRNSIEL